MESNKINYVESIKTITSLSNTLKEFTETIEYLLNEDPDFFLKPEFTNANILDEKIFIKTEHGLTVDDNKVKEAIDYLKNLIKTQKDDTNN
jgi:hypothetical protein